MNKASIYIPTQNFLEIIKKNYYFLSFRSNHDAKYFDYLFALTNHDESSATFRGGGGPFSEGCVGVCLAGVLLVYMGSFYILLV